MEAKSISKLKRSVKLTSAQVNYLKKAKSKHSTITDAAIALQINKDVLERAIAFGSCSEKTYRKLFPTA